MTAFIQGQGDRAARLGEWIGTPGSGSWIEGFNIRGPGDVGLEYQALFDKTWLSPPVSEGQFCGSRGSDLPLHGFKIQLLGADADLYDCRCNATFVDGTSVSNVSAMALCAAESLAPLEAFQIILRRRSSADRSGARKEATGLAA